MDVMTIANTESQDRPLRRHRRGDRHPAGRGWGPEADHRDRHRGDPPQLRRRLPAPGDQHPPGTRRRGSGAQPRCPLRLRRADRLRGDLAQPHLSRPGGRRHQMLDEPLAAGPAGGGDRRPPGAPRADRGDRPPGADRRRPGPARRSPKPPGGRRARHPSGDRRRQRRGLRGAGHSRSLGQHAAKTPSTSATTRRAMRWRRGWPGCASQKRFVNFAEKMQQLGSYGGGNHFGECEVVRVGDGERARSAAEAFGLAERAGGLPVALRVARLRLDPGRRASSAPCRTSSRAGAFRCRATTASWFTRRWARPRRTPTWTTWRWARTLPRSTIC